MFERISNLGGNHPLIASPEALMIQDVFEVHPNRMDTNERMEYDELVSIAMQFSRTDMTTGEYQIISKSRVAAIPAITARHMRLLEPARGVLTVDEVRESWRINMPENDGTRHPDLLFDMTQRNFGTDEPTGDITMSIMRNELRRRQLIEAYKSQVRYEANQRRYEQDLDQEADEAIDAFIDHWR